MKVTALILTAVIVTFAIFFTARDHIKLPRTFDAALNTTDTPRTLRDYGRLAVERKLAKLKAKGSKPFDKPREAAEFFVAQRVGADQSDIPLEHLYAQLLATRARERALAMNRTGPQSGPGGITSWNELGPGNVGGRTRAIVIDPTNSNIMYAAGVAGGVWKSTDAGASWNPTDDLMLNLAVCALAIDPTNPNVLYAGTGEGYYSASVFVRGLGIFKSTDAGATWNQLSGTVNGVPSGAFYYVNKVRISPNDPNSVYAATRFGVWRSTDAGQTWSAVLANPRYYNPGGVQTTLGCSVGCTDLALRTDSTPDVLFAAFGSLENDGLYRSDDGGNTWVQYTTPTYQGRMTLAIAPSDNDRVYLVMADNGGLSGWGRIVSVFRADDGVNFTSVLDPSHPFSPWLMSYVSIATGCFEYPYIPSQGWYDNIVAVDPLDADKVWVGGINVYRSDDAGQTFGLAGYWFFFMMDPPPPTYMHPDQHIIVFDPDYDGITNQTMWVGNDGGLFRTTNARAATSQEECPIDSFPGPPPDIAWDFMNNGYGVTQFYHGDAAKQTDRFVAGAQDNGTSKVDGVGIPNSWATIFGGDGGYVAIDHTDPDHFFVEIQGFPEIQVTTDGGLTFTEATSGITDTDGLFITPFAMDPSDPNVLWTGGSRPWRTTNGTALWEVAGPDFAGPAQISAIAIAPSDPNVVYLGFNNGYVARTTDGLAPSPTWTVFANGLFGAWVSSVAVDPVDPDVAYITYSTYGIPHVLRTANGGVYWQPIDGVPPADIPDVPTHWVAVRPCNSQQLYAGTEIGIFASDDGGATWQPANTGLANTVVESLDFKDDDTIVAFTHGRGAFLASLDPCSPATGVNTDVPRVARLSSYPNPFRSEVTVHASIPSSGRARVEVYDVAGRRVAALLDEQRTAGDVSVVWDGRDDAGGKVAQGVYFVRLIGKRFSTTKKIVLVR
jgi:photosystem II stability/assembly factor-like uncharacterized protein